MLYNGNIRISDLKSIFFLRTKRTVGFAYGFMFVFVLVTIFLTLVALNRCRYSISVSYLVTIFLTLVALN